MSFSTTMQFFRLFFTLEIVTKICEFTNDYADTHHEEKSSYEWTPITPDEFYKYLGLIIYMGIVQISSLEVYWSKDVLYLDFHFPSNIIPKTLQSN